jgi:hypothetical protein
MMCFKVTWLLSSDRAGTSPFRFSSTVDGAVPLLNEASVSLCDSSLFGTIEALNTTMTFMPTGFDGYCAFLRSTVANLSTPIESIHRQYRTVWPL